MSTLMADRLGQADAALETKILSLQETLERLQGQKATLMREGVLDGKDSTELVRCRTEIVKTRDLLHDAAEQRAILAALHVEEDKRRRDQQAADRLNRADALDEQAREALRALPSRGRDLAAELVRVATLIEESLQLRSTGGGIPVVRNDIRSVALKLQTWFDPSAIGSIIR